MVFATGINDLMHPFGQDTLTYSHEFDLPSTFPAFSQVFDLLVTDGVSDRWTKSEWQYVIAAIMSNDTTDTGDDVFGKVWDYFCRAEADSNAAHAGVRFNVDGTTFTKIELVMYDSGDLPDPCSESTYGYACRGYSYYGQDRLTINASPTQSESVVLGLGIAHELQHLCFKMNAGYGYDNINETLSTLAEYFVDSWRDFVYDFPYDASFLRNENCDANSKYQIERIWITYLYEVFKGGVADPADDLVYRWIRSNATPLRFSLEALEVLLWDDDFDWLGGADEADRLNRLVANYLSAKFANAPDFAAHGEFGIGPVNTVLDFGLFQDNCTWYAGGTTPMTPVDCPDNIDGYPSGHAGCWNVRVVLPEYVVGATHENLLTAVSGTYEDGDAPLPTGDGDGSMDYIDVSSYGTDYIVFRPDSYYEDGNAHELRVRVGGKPKNTSPPYPESSRIKPIGWVLGYSADSETLQAHPEDLAFVEPISFTPATSVGDTVVSTISVADFGRSIKAVVVAIGNVPVDHYNWYAPTNAFIYEYRYGVSTPEIEAFSRISGSLHAQPDTAAAGCPQGDGDEVVITVALDPDFYDAAISKSLFTVMAPDTAVLYAAVEADSDATLINGMYRTTITLREFGSCGEGEVSILLNGQTIGSVSVDMRSVDMIANGVVAVSDAARFALAYESPPKAYDPCADFRPVAGTVTSADWAFFGSHYNHSMSSGNMSIASATATEATLRLDLQEENTLLGERRLWATLSVENVEPFRAIVVSVRSDHLHLRYVGWEQDAGYAPTTMSADARRHTAGVHWYRRERRLARSRDGVR